MKTRLLCIGLIITTTGCVSADPNSIDPLELAISGKTLVADTAELTLNSDRTLQGKIGNELEVDLIGTWYVDDGRFCRTISEPANLAGKACQNMRLYENGTVLEVDGVNRTVRYQVR